MLEAQIAAAAKGMRAELDRIRADFRHSGNKGSSVEEILRTFLREYLPGRLEVGHGEIVDRNGNRSRQTDVVIASEEHPFTFRREAPGLFFIEGVSAVGEVKTSLNDAELSSAFAAARQYKVLTSIAPNGALVVATQADAKRYYAHPPFFLFAFESQLSMKTLVQKIGEQVHHRYSPGESIDGIFVLDRGWMIDLGNGDESFVYRDPTTKVPYRNWKGRETDEVLFTFLAWLSMAMPRMLGGSPIIVPYMISQTEAGEKLDQVI